MAVPGFKYNMTDMQAVIGIEQLKNKKKLEKRKYIWDAYYDEFRQNQLAFNR